MKVETVKIIFFIKRNDTKSVHPPEYISKNVQNAKLRDRKNLTTYPSPIVHWVRLTIVPLGGPQGPGGLMAKSFIFGPILLKLSPGLHIRKLLKDFA